MRLASNLQIENRQLANLVACYSYPKFLFCPDDKCEDLVSVSKVANKDGRASIG